MLALIVGVGLISLAAVGLSQALRTPATTGQQQVAEIGATLRCPTCQGLSVADSPSKVATSMREIIAEQLAAGRSADEIREHFVARYGDWILLSPRTSGLGWLVWLLPVLAVTGAAGAVLTLLRRGARRRPAVAAPDLEAARTTEETWRAGRLALPQTPAGERLEAALEAAASARADHAAGDAGGQSLDVALGAVGRALAAQRREAAASRISPRRAAAGSGTEPTARLRPSARRWAGVGGVAAFTLVAGGLLVSNLAPRGAGDLPTGNLPDRTAAAEQPPAVIDDLRAAVQADPDDPRLRLQLAAQLLRRPDGVDEARAQAQAVLDRTGGEQPDALLLLGITQMAQGDPAGPGTLQRYLSVAAADHPGVDVARSLLEGERR